MRESGYDLEDRTFAFARAVRRHLPTLPLTVSNREDGKQLIRSSGSVAANYIEANESLSKKDFLVRLKICRKEAKESMLWLKLLIIGRIPAITVEHSRLQREAGEILRIFCAIIRKVESASGIES